MKKVIIAVLLVVAFTLAFAGPVFAGNGNGKGNVTVDLVVHQAGDGLSSGDVVGSVKLNTNANGGLRVLVNIGGVPLEDWDIRVWQVNGTATMLYEGIDVINTNHMGEGNYEVMVPLGDYGEAETINVSVVIRENMPAQTVPSFFNSWP